MPIFEPPETRFWRYVDKSGPCWLWLGGKSRKYGVFHLQSSLSRRRTTYAHRFSWELRHGPIPTGQTIDHLCEVPRCVNPDHLRCCTLQENIRRSAYNRRQTRGTHSYVVDKTDAHCRQGHELTPDNLIVSYSCKCCRQASWRAISKRGRNTEKGKV